MLKLPLHRLPGEVDTLHLAISGGLDSRAMLQLLLEQATAYSIELWHVNYALQDNANHMENLVRELAAIHETAKVLPVVHAPNFSVGVNTLFWLTRHAARILGNDRYAGHCIPSLAVQPHFGILWKCTNCP